MASEVEELERLIEVAKLKILNSEQYLRTVENIDSASRTRAEEVMRQEYMSLQVLYEQLAEIQQSAVLDEPRTQ